MKKKRREKTTGELQQELMEQSSIKSYLNGNRASFIEADFLKQLEALHKQCGLTKAALARKSGMSEVYLHQVFFGRRTPSRDRLVSLCVGLGASLEELQQILKQAGYAQLYPKVRRDAIIIYGLLHRRQPGEINDDLFAENEKTLF